MKSARFNWLALVGAVVGGAIAGGGVWYVLNEFVINGKGILLRAGWPLNTPVLFAVAGAVLTAIAVIRSNQRAQSLREELPEVAGALGLAYEEGDFEIPPGARPWQPFLQEWGRCENRLSGTSEGVPAQMFDLTTISRDSDTSNKKWTVVLFQQNALPEFACIPKSWSTFALRSYMPSVSLNPEVGDQTACQAVADFEKTYQLSVPKSAVRYHEDEVRRLFRAPRLEALARQPGWHVQSGDGWLFFARSGTAVAADRAAMWRESIELRRALLAPVSSALMSIPAAPGMERDRRSNRQSGRSWGRIVGAVVGSFGSFIAFAAVGVSRRPAPGFTLAFFPVVLGGMAVCAFAGTQLGGWLADRSYRPTADGAPTLGIGGGSGWVVAGALAGFILGTAVGMGLAMALVRQIQATWVMPIVFLSPPALCVLLGGFAGYRVACRRAARPTGA